MHSPSRILQLVVTLLIASWVLASTTLHAQRLDWKLEDFKPLTELPWSFAEPRSLDDVLAAIFREPDSHIRYLTLASYLREIPEEQLGVAFDKCIILEGKNSPAEFIEFYLRIWAERDPVACWGRTHALIQLTGIENGWLAYDSWKSREKISVRDAKAIEGSRFWIENEFCLLGFPRGVRASSLPEAEKVGLYRQFADAWFGAFRSWPEYHSSESAYPIWKSRALMDAFWTTPQVMRDSVRPTERNANAEHASSVEVGMRRWLRAEPKAALEILKKQDELLGHIRDGGSAPLPTEPSTPWLMIWREVDLPAMIKWAESLELGEWKLGTRVRGMLMSWVDDGTRVRWLKEAGKAECRAKLLSEWGSWNPQAAMNVALAAKDSQFVRDVADSAAFGPFFIGNTCHPGLGFIRSFDAYGLCKDFEEDIRNEWGIFIMEQWGDIDVGEAARYGLDFILKSDYVPRQNLISLFSGDDEFATDADMVDRTFCALRVWAVTKPDEMKAWIGTLKDEDLRTALTWLAENPWGTGPEE